MSQERIQLARELMAKGEYYAAREVLETIAEHPQAVGLLATIDQIAPKGQKRKRSLADLIEDDPYNQEQFLGKEAPVFIKQKSSVLESKNYTLTAFFILIAYCAFWPIGMIANIMTLGEARQLQERSGYKPKGIGCLWSLLFLNVFFCGLMFVMCSLMFRFVELFAGVY